MQRTLYLVVPKLPRYTEPQVWKQTAWIDTSVERIEQTGKYFQYAVEVRLVGPPVDKESVAPSDRIEGTFGISLGPSAEQFLQIPVVLRSVPLESEVPQVKLKTADADQASK